MQQLHDRVAEHHLARSGGDILADHETVGRLADGQLALAALDIGQQIVQPLDQIFPIGGDGGLQHLGIGEREVGGGQRIGELAGIEGHAAALARVQAVQLAHHLLHRIGGEQIALLDEVEDFVLAPGIGLEAPVAGRGFHHGWGVAAQHAPRGGFPQHHEIVPPCRLRRSHRLAVAAHRLGQRQHGAGDIKRIDRPPIFAASHAGDEIQHQLLALHPDRQHVAREFAGVERFGHLCRFGTGGRGRAFGGHRGERLS